MFVFFFNDRVMMSSMVLFILWMCYCCRWKDKKFDATTSADRPQPFWIDVNSNAYYEALQWSLHQVINTLINKINVFKNNCNLCLKQKKSIYDFNEIVCHNILNNILLEQLN